MLASLLGAAAEVARRALAKKYGWQWTIFGFVARVRGFGNPAFYEVLETVELSVAVALSVLGGEDGRRCMELRRDHDHAEVAPAPTMRQRLRVMPPTSDL